MQHLLYGINSVVKITIVHRLALLRGTLRHAFSDCRRLRFGPLADHARITNAFIVVYYILSQSFDAVGWACKNTEWQGAGVICLERGADLHTAQLMPLQLTVSCFSKSRLVLPFWYQLTQVVTDEGPLNGCVCECVCKPELTRTNKWLTYAPVGWSQTGGRRCRWWSWRRVQAQSGTSWDH